MKANEGDVRIAEELLRKLDAAWAGLPIPTLPDYLKGDREFGPLFKHISGKAWSEVEITHGPLYREFWLQYLPTEERRYYFATFLHYSLVFFCDNWNKQYPDADQEFLGMIWMLKDSSDCMHTATQEQRDCIADILRFIVARVEHFGYEIETFPEVTTDLYEALSLWSGDKDSSQE
ncbi:hypothetical protein LOC68_07630 [Blastopirellula sp. JC732]|uniref:Uncharacterized protein n=1 Tax=Blastopirellula sediminis TaxID=2894196 RepID=A0A9X1MKJ9_9BACT|nr:hypothetical protein [Blastopirellula sediminis]MCC9608962.1 hypothetical protein [Blastopirellula sediminis]MCC9628261.1 hypothetical protein [Blastopirellula sediminis]